MNKKEFEKVKNWIHFACDTCGVPELTDQISIEFNNRFTSRMGDATTCYTKAKYFNKYTGKMTKYRIRFSNPLWPRATEKQKREVAIHEACHIIHRYLHGQKGSAHGYEWKQLMRICGLSPERCHNVDTTGLKRRRKKYRLKCRCSSHLATSIIAKRVYEGNLYRCVSCKAIIELHPSESYPFLQKQKNY